MSTMKVPYFKWRDGRPRWEPGPELRAKGYKGRDLKDAAGRFLPKGPALDAAEAINAAIASGADLAVPVSGVRTLSDLFAQLRASPKFRDGPSKGERLAARTRKGYLAHLALLGTWGGSLALAGITPANIEDLHAELCEARGVAMANAILRTFKLALNYAVHKLRWLDRNPCTGVKLHATEGRTVMWTPEEIETFVAAADWCGRESIGDGQILGLLTGQIRGDILALPELALEAGVYRIRRQKTGRMCYVPPTKPLAARLALMRARKAARWPGTRFAHELIDVTTGKPYPAEGSRFTDEHRAVRAIASGLAFAIEDFCRALGHLPQRLRNLPFVPMPSILDKRFQDLRDTAVTYLFDAGCDIALIATITGHSLKTVQEILDKHYFVRHAGMAIRAGHMLDALLERTGIGA